MWLAQKNGSLTDSSLLQGLKDKRDLALEQLLNPEETADNMGLGLGNTKAKANKVQQNAQHMVSIDVDGVPVSVLCPCFRTGQADLQVLVDENMLKAVFHHLLPAGSIPQSQKERHQKTKGRVTCSKS